MELPQKALLAFQRASFNVAGKQDLGYMLNFDGPKQREIVGPPF